MFLDHEMGLPAGVQAAQPRLEQLMQRRFADPDRRVGQDPVESNLLGDLIGRADSYAVGGPDRFGIRLGEVPGPGVGVDGPESTCRSPQSGNAGNGTPTAAEVEGHRPFIDPRALGQQQLRAGIESI